MATCKGGILEGMNKSRWQIIYLTVKPLPGMNDGNHNKPARTETWTCSSLYVDILGVPLNTRRALAPRKQQWRIACLVSITYPGAKVVGTKSKRFISSTAEGRSAWRIIPKLSLAHAQCGKHKHIRTSRRSVKKVQNSGFLREKIEHVCL
jgi:hypothetical protein